MNTINFKLFEQEGKYANKNLLNATISVIDNDQLQCEFRFGKEYEEMFGIDLFPKFQDEPLIYIKLVIDDSDISDLMLDEDDDIFDRNSTEFDENSIFIPISDETPREYKYRLAAFYVHAKEYLNTQGEIEYFKGIGHSLLCWVFDKSNLNENSILALEASGDGDQHGLVEFYKKLGFKTCDLSKLPQKWYRSSSASGICMFTKISNFKRVCSSKERRFKSVIEDPFENFHKL